MATKALILAAGFGTRLKPLTDHIPKPLLPFFGPSLLDFAIYRVRQAGIQHIAVNAHHLAPLIQSHLHRPEYRNIVVSVEDTILGTAGAVNPLRHWIGDDDLLIFNADIIADIDLSALLEGHRLNRAVASMVLLRKGLAGKNPVYATEDRVVRIGGEAMGGDIKPRTFACAHLLSPSFLGKIVPSGASEIVPIYNDLLRSGERVNAIFHGGFWRDLGTPQDFWQAYADVFEKFSLYRYALGIDEVCAQLAIWGGKTSIEHRTYIAPGAKVAEDAQLDNAVVFSGARLGSQEIVKNTLVSAHSRVGF